MLFLCTNANAMTVSKTEILKLTDCSTVTSIYQCCYNTTNFTLCCGNGTICNSITVGANAYVYIGYASDINGATFSYSPNPSLDYIAVLSTDTEILVPVASDFTG